MGCIFYRSTPAYHVCIFTLPTILSPLTPFPHSCSLHPFHYHPPNTPVSDTKYCIPELVGFIFKKELAPAYHVSLCVLPTASSHSPFSHSCSLQSFYYHPPNTPLSHAVATKLNGCSYLIYLFVVYFVIYYSIPLSLHFCNLLYTFVVFLLLSLCFHFHFLFLGVSGVWGF